MDPAQSTSTTTPDAFRVELLARLGLPADASAHDVASARQALVSLAERAPADQQEWARAQVAEADAVVSLLAELDAQASPAPADAEGPTSATAASGRRRTVVLVIAGLVLGIGAVFGWHLMSNASGVPGIDGAPDPTTTSDTATLDQAKVGALMQRIAANPKDVEAYQQLAEQYFAVGDYANSSTFSQKALAIKPNSDLSLVALGASQFNQGNTAAALKSWQRAVAVNPKNIEAHYDLGFAYLSGDKPDMAKVKAEWEQVVKIDPNSDIAKNVQTHLQSLAKASPAPSGK